jgi:hypothetical protein
MRSDWLYELRLNNEVDKLEAKSILKSIAEIRRTLDEKDCKFSITAVGVLGTLLDETERQATCRAK